MRLSDWKKNIRLAEKKEDLISFINGSPSREICKFYYPILNKIIKKLLKSKHESLFFYALPQGNLELRKEICESDSEKVLITNGSQQALKLIIETLLKPGDEVMMEIPVYIGAEKPFLDRGVVIKELSEKNIVKNPPKLVYLIPDFNNPTGQSWTLLERKKIVKLAKKYNFWIIEDQTYRQLNFDEKKTIRSISSLYDKTLVIGTISKLAVPGLRIGWIIVKEKKVLENLALNKESFDLATSNLDQQIAAELLKKIKKDKRILKKVRFFYARKMAVLINGLEKNLKNDFEWIRPDGGYYLWLKSKKKIKVDELFLMGLDIGVGFTPGFLFYLNGKKNTELRLSIANVEESRIEEGIKRFTKAYRDYILNENFL